MLEWIETIMRTLGYPGIAFLMFPEVIFPPIPSEIIMPLAGFTAHDGSLNFLGVVLAGTVGSLVGALLYYYLGWFVGTERLVTLADRYGKWLTISGDDVRKADQWFDRHGQKVVFFCRLIPGIRSLVSIPAGVSEMRLTPFLLYTFLGSTLWNVALTYAGYLLGQNYELVEAYMGSSGKIVLAVLALIVIIWYIVRLLQQRRKESGQQPSRSSQKEQSSQQQEQSQEESSSAPH